MGGTGAELILQDRIGLIDAAIALNKPGLSEHSLVSNLSLLVDYFSDFPARLVISTSESLIRFRMARVFAIPDKDERLSAISLFVSECLEVWDMDDLPNLMDHTKASFKPVFAFLLENAKAESGTGMASADDLFGALVAETETPAKKEEGAAGDGSEGFESLVKVPQKHSFVVVSSSYKS